MSFLIACPNCGPRCVYEFHFGGQYQIRPSPESPDREWARYRYFRENTSEEQLEWWLHSKGCRCWFLGTRRPDTNKIISTFWPQDLVDAQRGPAGG